MFFFNETTGFALSWFLYKTTDGGLSWGRNKNAPGGYDILFLDTLTGFIGGSNLFKTTNGGESWYQVNGVPGGVGKIFFINSLMGWAISGRNILKTTDGGENWFVQFNHPSVGFSSIHFVDSLYGWTSGGRPQKTTDGGTTWVEQTNTTIWNSDDVYFTNWDTGWIGKYSSISNSLFKTTNGGLNWIGIPEVIGARKFYYFPDPIHWMTIGFSRYYITNDFGNSWIEFTENVPSGLSSFQAPTNNLGYAVGSSGLILRYDDTSFVPVELLSFEGIAENNEVVLVWQTASEINNQGFYIEKSYDKINWKNIGFIDGKGTATETNYYKFADVNPGNNENHYRLKQVDFNGTFTYSKIITVYFKNTPLAFTLYQNYPNPFNPSTIIKFDLPKSSLVSLTIYDILGRKMKTIVDERKDAGSYLINVDLSDLSSGVYFYHLHTDNFNATKKMLLLR